MDSSYETMRYRRIENKIKFTWMILQLLKRLFEPQGSVLATQKLQMWTFKDLASTDSSYEIMQYRGIGKKMEIH